MNLIDKILYLLFLAVFSSPAFKLNAQSEDRLSCVASVTSDSILLRWAPASVAVWQTGISYGYIIKRYTIAKNGVFLPDGLNNGITLTEKPIRCASEEYFEELSLVDPKASIVQAAIYGKEFLPDPIPDDFESFMKSYEEREVSLGFALFICDMSQSISKAAGLLFTDKMVIKGERYAYMVIPSAIPEGMTVDPAVVVTDAGIPTELPSIIDVRAVFTNRAVKFRWPLMINKGVYSAYVLEKSLDGKTFNSVSDLPLVNFSEQEEQDYFIYTDSLRNNNEKVWYRVRGITPFGERGPSSEVIAGQGVEEIAAYASIDTAWVDEEKGVVINWKVTESHGEVIKEINLMRSDNHNGPFIRMNRKPLSPKSRTFVDPSPGQNNYYQVILSTEGNQSSSSFPYFVQIEDDTPPSAPVMISGNVDSSGAVTIIWKENTESDLMGYKVFRANSREDEFIPLQQGIVSVNICHDSINLNTLAKKIFYQVIAIDKNYNSSDYSSVLELSRPDTVKPSPAIIKRLSCNNNGKIHLIFDGSPSNDVSSYTLYRKGEQDSSEVYIAGWDILPVFYDDSFSGRNQGVEYRLTTIDDAGNSSINKRIVYIRSVKTEKADIIATYSTDGRSVIVEWTVPTGFIPGKAIIYRGTGNNPSVIYRTLSGETMIFEDEDIELSTSYTYRILLYSNDQEKVISSDEYRLD